MKRRALLTGGLLLPILPAAAQDAYPSRPIQMIVPFPSGGVADITGRPTAHVLALHHRLEAVHDDESRGYDGHAGTGT